MKCLFSLNVYENEKVFCRYVPSTNWEWHHSFPSLSEDLSTYISYQLFTCILMLGKYFYIELLKIKMHFKNKCDCVQLKLNIVLIWYFFSEFTKKRSGFYSLKCYLLCIIKCVENCTQSNSPPQGFNKKSNFSANKIYIF